MAKKVTFEDAIARLEKIVQDLENENKPLDQMLADFNEGVKLLNKCRQQLVQAEQAMQQTLEFPEQK